jgi:ABC-2 type transport system ATP-binding protein
MTNWLESHSQARERNAAGPLAGLPRVVVATMDNVPMVFDSYLVRALRGITFSIRRGEVFGVLGPSGSGKSTALKLLAGRLRPTEGKVRAFGRSPHWSRVKARIGYLPGREGPRHGGGWRRWSSLLASLFSPASGSSARNASTLQRRARLQQAVLGNRDLIVLDDPFWNLDPAERAEAMELIRTLARRGVTVVLACDALRDAVALCDRVAFLDEGKLQAVGALPGLLGHPEAIRFTAPLLPASTAEHVLKLIRDELNIPPAPSGPNPRFPDAAVPNASENAPAANNSLTLASTATANTPLQDAANAPATEKVVLPSPDGVNHAKLDALTKPSQERSAASKARSPAPVRSRERD